MAQKWNAAKFLEKLRETVDYESNKLMLTLGLEPDYKEGVPKFQYPAPGPRSTTRFAHFEFPEALDPETVNPKTVLLRSGTPPTLVASDVKLVDKKTIAVRPSTGWASSGLIQFILTPGIRKADGREFAGFLITTMIN